MYMYLAEIADKVDGVLLGEDLKISQVSIDTRTLLKGDLYIAIQGNNFDGHTFIDKAQIAGASAVLVTKKVPTKLAQIIVKDSCLALTQLANAWKTKIIDHHQKAGKPTTLKTIAITGSNGKTTVKEMVAAILGLNGNMLCTQGNLNNHIGVPCTMLKLHEQHQYAVIEVGASHAGEIANNCAHMQTDIVIINNAGAAHIEGFGSVEGVARAKGEIIQSLGINGVVVLNRDDDYYTTWKTLAHGQKIVTFGISQMADYRAEAINLSIQTHSHVSEYFETHFKLITSNDEMVIRLKLAGFHNVMNALAATAAAKQLGIGLPQIKQGLEQLQAVNGRLQPRIGKHGGLIIDDSYNANPNSVKRALQVLIASGGQPWVVLGALAEMGKDSLQIHKELGELMKSMKIVRLLTIGSDARHTSLSFGNRATFFSSQTQLIKCLQQELTGCESVLVKGSRSQKMENIVAQLVETHACKPLHFKQ